MEISVQFFQREYAFVFCTTLSIGYIVEYEQKGGVL